ncbi:uncharacterized protein LOC100679975 isoform X1 [Nasonia vitripennis]|uniref:Uncharacterized protein n=1 Tax=Nasonia vitripennis TaxID=7425 RepID=A0A7M7HG71_NASVI|nr:uncharacterized protein LOC100679975 isoform X1 [Nasonia vitripennis]XP_008215789.1 uncharacterized protein LOC100679975 isoform X1 [Nasonia vitripennis]
MWNRKVCIRVIELLLCIACVVALRVTDDESRRVFHYLRNRSLEWSLLNNVTWGSIGAALATATCGGYIIVTAGLLIAAASGELRGRVTERCLLGLGVILFGIVGALSMASIDSVPNDLIDNAAVLGTLCLVTAMVFIADMLMSPVVGKKKHDGTQTISSKEQAKQYVTTTTMTINEKEPNKKVSTWRSPTPEMTEKRNSMNDSVVEDDDRDDREHRLERAERQMREYAQNIENGRGARGKPMRDRDDMPRKINGYYRNDDVYQRPVDEVDDAPPFPTNGDTPVFAKVMNPGVKIMRVDRDDERGYDNYRYSDSSQYDNVPTRMRGSSPGILKRQRDVSFSDPRRSRGYRPQEMDEDHPGQQRRQHRGTRDEIEMLEESFDALRTSTMTTTTTSAATQTTGADRKTSTATIMVGAPVTPNDPGYVRHMSSNWPQNLKPKTP